MNLNILFIILILIILNLIISKCINKYCKYKFKIVWIKIFIILSCLCFISGLIIYSIFSFNNDSFIYFWFLSTISCAFQFYISIVNGDINPPKPDKYILKQTSYEEFSNYLNKRVKEYDYELVSNKENLKVYRRVINKKICYIIDTRLEELTEDNFNELYDKEIFPIIEEDFKKIEKKRYELYVTLIISVNRITSMFNKFIEEADEDLRYQRLPVGISFGGNKMYMPSMIDGFEEPQMKKIQKEFKEIMKVSE